MALPDGSRIELKDGTRVVVQYSETERRVKLTGGEAHFTVWKDRARPFIVDAGGVEVRAVGTAFNVRLGENAVEVLVTEGRVKVAGEQGARSLESGAKPEPLFISIGERAVVPFAGSGEQAPVITPVTVDDISRELDWQAPWLQFKETPLAEAVAEFNRLNRHQIVVADPALNQRRIGGRYRPDNVEGFVRMLNTSSPPRPRNRPERTTSWPPATRRRG
jgi:transmembrane sensor